MKSRVGYSSLIILVALLVTHAALAAGADNLKDRVAALEATVASLQTTVASLQTQLNTANANIGALQTTVNNLTSQLATLQSNGALGPLASYVSVDTSNTINGLAAPHIIITGANVHIRSGSNATDDGGGTPLGLGNLIVGYNEEPNDGAPVGRSGSHNLIVGPEHRYLSTGGLVAGQHNTISGLSASVSGGEKNTASGQAASVSGGYINTASGGWSSVSGGEGTSGTRPAGTTPA